MFFYLKVSCKNKRVLQKFIKFLISLNASPIFIKVFSKHKKQKFVTVLKSPHVNKTAQEQFEYRFYSKHFLIYSFKPLRFFLLLKKLKSLSFSGINLEVKGSFETHKTYKHSLKTINPDNIVLKNLNYLPLTKEKFKMVKQTISPNLIFNYVKSDIRIFKKYIQLFDSYGEVYLKNAYFF